MRNKRRISVILLLLAAGWQLASALQQGIRDVLRDRPELVVVPVTVKDSPGNLVLDLQQREFRIFEDGVEQNIEFASLDPFPLSAVVLLDNALSGRNAEQVQQSLPAIAGGFSEFDEVAVARFETIAETPSEFFTENDALHSYLKRVELGARSPGLGSGPMTSGPRINAAPVGPQVGTTLPRAQQERKSIDDAVLAAANHLQSRDRLRRKVILVVSDVANSRSTAVSFESVLRVLLTERITVYTLGYGVGRFDRGNNIVARYATATGGEVFYAGNRAELESYYSRVTEQARNQYTIAYRPAQTDRRGEYRDLEVRVRRPSLRLLAPQGYFVPSGS